MKQKINIVKVKNVKIGEGFCVIAGPCAVESEEQLFKTAKLIKKNINILRGGAYKPRSFPDKFQGLKEEGLIILKKVSEKLNIPTVTEVLDVRDVALISEFSDMLQIGARNMANYSLLKEVGKTRKPVLLKRGFGSKIDELLGAAEYILSEGNNQIVLCERGIRTFETSLRFTLDFAGAIYLKQKTNFPVIIDPSHATGNPSLIKPLVKASIAAGIDGVIVEVHYNPKIAKCDAFQALTPKEFNEIFK
ncbi:MAG TPA: 3-deoxy-7-phosphoheptulonate synthase [Candidatus Pacearchaeota archaeon]|nr:3-deoxy-7-phosphoheptulonate synthase [Candidatus Pacearchaeota archaeon]